jgi:hypothetical protein
MSSLRTRSAWFMDTRHDRPSLFGAGADADCGTDHCSICHININSNGDTDSDSDSDRDTHLDAHYHSDAFCDADARL